MRELTMQETSFIAGGTSFMDRLYEILGEALAYMRNPQ